MKRTSTHHQSPRQIEYQPLESRQLLAAYVVTTLADDFDGSLNGQVSLREAIIAANTNAAFGDAVSGSLAGDTITFDAALAGSAIVLVNGQLTISDDLAIKGGNLDLTVDGNGTSRIFHVSTAEAVSFSGLTLANGLAVQGGAIALTGGGNATLFRVQFESNLATELGGGGLYNANKNVFLTECTFVANQATGISGSGGAIYSAAGTIALKDCLIQANVANRSGGGIEIVNGELFATDTRIGGMVSGQGNVAGPAGNENPGSGGGIHVSGTLGTTVSIRGGAVAGNVAAESGGGIWTQINSTLRVRSGASLEGNVSEGTAASAGGGAVFNAGGTLRFVDASIRGNVAANAGGGIYSSDGEVSCIRSTFFANAAARAGGAIAAVNGFLYLDQTQIGGSFANRNSAGANGTGFGGGVHLASSGNATLVLNNSNLSFNSAVRSGGGIWQGPNNVLRIRTQSTLSGNVSEGNSSGDGGGAIFNSGGLVVIANSTLSGNQASGSLGSGGAIFSSGGNVLVSNSTLRANTAVRAGGGLEVTGGYVRLTDTTLGGGLNADGNWAGDASSGSPGLGGGIHLSGAAGTRVIIDGGTVAGNRAFQQGGAFWIESDNTLVIRNAATVSNNGTVGSTSAGGGAYVRGHLQVIDSVFANHFTATSGGAIFIDAGGSATLDASLVSGNHGGDFGGGIYNRGYLSLEFSEVSSNLANLNGGGVFNEATATYVEVDSDIFGNLPNDFNL